MTRLADLARRSQCLADRTGIAGDTEVRETLRSNVTDASVWCGEALEGAMGTVVETFEGEDDLRSGIELNFRDLLDPNVPTNTEIHAAELREGGAVVAPGP